ncbi:MAG: M48 family metallopeptidase [Spirochaetes bacterium]|nr:M48 family metallopeptidase [Spirochaetota bacterium]
MDIRIDRLIRSKRKSVGLEITGKARLIVRVPHSLSLKRIERIVLEKRNWIERKLGEVRKKRSRVIRKNFLAGEVFYYLGRQYPLVISDGVKAPIAFDDKFILSRGCRNKARELFIAFYRQETVEIAAKKAKVFAEKYKLKYEKINSTRAEKRWGSCSSKGSLNFSYRLVMAPPAVIEYVVAHEIAHLEHQNHSEKFWGLVGKILPGYKERRAWLKKNGFLLVL